VIKIKIEIEVQYCSSHRCDVFDFISFKCCLYLNISCLLLTTNVTAVYSVIHWLIACFLTPLHFPLPSSSLPSPPSLLLSLLSSIPTSFPPPSLLKILTSPPVIQMIRLDPVLPPQLAVLCGQCRLNLEEKLLSVI
jgi:hypothetical protein